MKSRDFTKLAMMGLVGGCLLGSSQASAQNSSNSNTNNQGVLLAKSCGGGCGGRTVADNGCGGSKQSQGYYRSNSNTASSGCSGKSQSQGYYDNNNNNTASNGCGGSKQSQGYYKSSSNTASNGCGGSKQSRGYIAENDMNQGRHQMINEEDFVKTLSPEAKNTFQNMSAEGKAMAISLSSGGQMDRNAAVRLAAQKMAEKRSSMNQSSNSSYNSNY